MPWTTLHAALGRTDGDLTLELIQQACDERVRERDDLDWKRALPVLRARDGSPEQVEHDQAELAKDVAAMANSGGGTIVFGVAQAADGTSAAEHIDPIGTVDETITRGIRQTVAARIEPTLTGLELVPVYPDDDPAAGVLVMIVPDSLDAPHLVHPKTHRDYYQAPVRRGADTERMNERALEAAFNARAAGRRQRHQDLDDRYEHFTRALTGGGRGPIAAPWVAMFAAPDRPARSTGRQLSLHGANRVFERARRMPWASTVVDVGPSALWLSQDAPPRHGLRSYSMHGSEVHRQQNVGDTTLQGRVEVHADGAVAAAFTRDGLLNNDIRFATYAVRVDDFETVGRDLLALLWSTITTLGLHTNYNAKVGVNANPGMSLAPTFYPRSGYENELAAPIAVPNFRAVDGPIMASLGLEQLLNDGVALIADVVNQAGAACYLDAAHILTQAHLDS